MLKIKVQIREIKVNSLKRCRSEEHTSELQSPDHLVCRVLLEKKKDASKPGRRSTCLRASSGWYTKTACSRSPARGALFFKHTSTTEIYTLALHDALPI